jgi:hypothetical protein
MPIGLLAENVLIGLGEKLTALVDAAGKLRQRCQ